MTTRWNRRPPVFLWRKRVDPNRVDLYEARLRLCAGNRLATIQRPQRKRILFEVSCDSRTEARKLEECFGGTTERLSSDWFDRFGRLQKTKPIKIGGRELIIPAEAAFGTGEHATTAMSLRLLERALGFWGAQAPPPAFFGASPKSFSRKDWRSRGRDRSEPDWHLHARPARSPELAVDLGTGTGILALAARILGAQRVIGIDHDPMAISTAKENARRNKSGHASFQLADVRRWKIPRRTQIVTANLFSELVIEVLPKLKRVPSLIFSGILRKQEHEVSRAMRRHKIDVVEVRRRGRWVAILGCGRGALTVTP